MASPAPKIHIEERHPNREPYRAAPVGKPRVHVYLPDGPRRSGPRWSGWLDPRRWAAALALALLAAWMMWPEPAPNPRPVPAWNAVRHFAYQLEDLDLSALGRARYDLLITDFSFDGEMQFTSPEVAGVKHGTGGGKLMLAYESVGEAEDDRWYWNRAWDLHHDGRIDAGAPRWLGAPNADWEGNYQVQYWSPQWQAIVTQYLDRILDAGFDGVCLDVCDAAKFWGPGGGARVNRPSADAEMIALITKLARHAHLDRGRPDFKIVVQNGLRFVDSADFLHVVDGVCGESVFYDDDDPTAPELTSLMVSHLDRAKAAGKLALVVDYVTTRSYVDNLYRQCAARGYLGYATVRALNRLTYNRGHEPN
jgi:cysteinyl-tRNA synthetase